MVILEFVFSIFTVPFLKLYTLQILKNGVNVYEKANKQISLTYFLLLFEQNISHLSCLINQSESVLCYFSKMVWLRINGAAGNILRYHDLDFNICLEMWDIKWTGTCLFFHHLKKYLFLSDRLAPALEIFCSTFPVNDSSFEVSISHLTKSSAYISNV